MNLSVDHLQHVWEVTKICNNFYYAKRKGKNVLSEITHWGLHLPHKFQKENSLNSSYRDGNLMVEKKKTSIQLKNARK